MATATALISQAKVVGLPGWGAAGEVGGRFGRLGLAGRARGGGACEGGWELA